MILENGIEILEMCISLMNAFRHLARVHDLFAHYVQPFKLFFVSLVVATFETSKTYCQNFFYWVLPITNNVLSFYIMKFLNIKLGTTFVLENTKDHSSICSNKHMWVTFHASFYSLKVSCHDGFALESFNIEYNLDIFWSLLLIFMSWFGMTCRRF